MKLEGEHKASLPNDVSRSKIDEMLAAGYGFVSGDTRSFGNLKKKHTPPPSVCFKGLEV